MAKVGLIDVDGHNFPNLALMRISAYHKAMGDDVSWWWGFDHYDIVYMSKVFSDAYSADADEPTNADIVIKGGTGYAISLVDGREVYDKSKDRTLSKEIEEMVPDYSIYPQYEYAVAMTSRGCPRGCAFCHVAAKEGRCSVKVADVANFYNGQKHIEVLDPNITACKDKHELFRQYIDTGASITFNQGIDIRMVTDDDINMLNMMRLKDVHFAWDNPKDDLAPKFKMWSDKFRRNSNLGMVYCLTNFNSTMEENLYRIYTLRSMGFDPYVMIYDKPHATREIRHLQRWCNNKIIFKSCPDFKDYLREVKK